MTQIVIRDQRDPETYAIIGAGMEVHRVLGRYFVEPVYQCALEWEFHARDIPFTSQVSLPVYYKQSQLRATYRADFLCYGNVLVELKAIERLTSNAESQLINYLAASGLRRGLLLNFGGSSLQYKRFVGPSKPNL